MKDSWDPRLYNWPILALPSNNLKAHFPASELISHRHQSWVWFSQVLKGFPVCPVQSNHCRSLWLNQNLKCAIIPYKCFLIHFLSAPKLFFDTALSKAWFSIGFNFVRCPSIKRCLYFSHVFDLVAIWSLNCLALCWGISTFTFSYIHVFFEKRDFLTALKTIPGCFFLFSIQRNGNTRRSH